MTTIAMKARGLRIAAHRFGRVISGGAVGGALLVAVLGIGPRIDAVMDPVIAGQHWTVEAVSAGAVRFAGNVDVGRDCALVRTRWYFERNDGSSNGLPRPEFARKGWPRVYGLEEGPNAITGAVLRPQEAHGPLRLSADLRFICGPFWTVHQQLGPIAIEPSSAAAAKD